MYPTVDCNENSSTHSNQPSAQQEFFHWAMRWTYARIPEDTSIAPDLSSLINLLEIIGFKLYKWEKFEDFHDFDQQPLNSKNVRVILECGNSHMMAMLELDSIECDCPADSSGSESDTSFRSVYQNRKNGNADENKINALDSGLPPAVPKAMSSQLRDVVYRLFKMMKTKNLKREKLEPHSKMNRSNQVLNSTFSEEKTCKLRFLNRTNSCKTSAQKSSRLVIPKSKNPTDNIQNNLFTASMTTPLSAHMSRMKISQQDFSNANKSDVSKKCLARQKSFDKPDDKNNALNTLRDVGNSDSGEEETSEITDCVVQAHNAVERAMNVISNKAVKKSNKPLMTDTDDQKSNSYSTNYARKSAFKKMKQESLSVDTDDQKSNSYSTNNARRSAFKKIKHKSSSSSSLSSSHNSQTEIRRLPSKLAKPSSITRRSDSSIQQLPSLMNPRTSSGTFRKLDETSSADPTASRNVISQLRKQFFAAVEPSENSTFSNNDTSKGVRDKKPPDMFNNSDESYKTSRIIPPGLMKTMMKPPKQIPDLPTNRFGYIRSSKKP